MQQRNKVLLALSAIALGSVALPSVGSAQDTSTPQQADAAAEQADAEFRKQCDWLSQQSKEGLQDYLRTNSSDDCAEVAALLLVAQTQAAQSAGGAFY